MLLHPLIHSGFLIASFISKCWEYLRAETAQTDIPRSDFVGTNPLQ